ncbi:hypothetical protein [Flavobacterium reichenbachii]|nr:hypothetical protein [Flavobacterium reichenbachii]
METLEFKIRIKAPAEKYGRFYGMMKPTENGQEFFMKDHMP